MRALRAHLAVPGGLAVLAALVIAAPARADVVSDWNATAAAALAAPGTAVPPGAGQGAIGAVNLAMVQVAVYDAVNAIAGGHEPYASSPAAEPWYSQEAAVAAAARHMLLNDRLNGSAGFAPGRVTAIETAYLNTLAGIPPGPAREGGIATGVAAATALIADRAGDGRFPAAPFYTFPVGTLPGEWRPTSGVNDPAAWLKDVRPFVLRDPDLFRARKPHALTTKAYADDFNEVKEIGSATSTTRTADQTAAAQYWGLTNPTATLASAMRSVADTQGGTLADHARVLAVAYANAADAAIVTWRDKARYLLWRPITAIQQGAFDGNPATEGEPTWTSLITAPPYPDHPSGLTGIGCALADSLQDFSGRDAATFSGTTLPTPAAPNGVTRTFTSFSQLCEDIEDARVWSGIHFRFADTEAAKLGQRVAHWGTRHAFK
ncbi:MAG TPA: vanadium-dependent haloperoxidase [Solirubrobacteraceae bacterium]|nr:vanadium-dependent haloperoxidase [Solirubrobacteraceae bacterium]